MKIQYSISTAVIIGLMVFSFSAIGCDPGPANVDKEPKANEIPDLEILDEDDDSEGEEGETDQSASVGENTDSMIAKNSEQNSQADKSDDSTPRLAGPKNK